MSEGVMVYLNMSLMKKEETANKKRILTNIITTQSARAAEYTPASVLLMTLNNLMVRFQ